MLDVAPIATVWIIIHVVGFAGYPDIATLAVGFISKDAMSAGQHCFGVIIPIPIELTNLLGYLLICFRHCYSFRCGLSIALPIVYITYIGNASHKV